MSSYSTSVTIQIPPQDGGAPHGSDISEGLSPLNERATRSESISSVYTPPRVLDITGESVSEDAGNSNGDGESESDDAAADEDSEVDHEEAVGEDDSAGQGKRFTIVPYFLPPRTIYESDRDGQDAGETDDEDDDKDQDKCLVVGLPSLLPSGYLSESDEAAEAEDAGKDEAQPNKPLTIRLPYCLPRRQTDEDANGDEAEVEEQSANFLAMALLYSLSREPAEPITETDYGDGGDEDEDEDDKPLTLPRLLHTDPVCTVTSPRLSLESSPPPPPPPPSPVPFERQDYGELSESDEPFPRAERDRQRSRKKAIALLGPEATSAVYAS